MSNKINTCWLMVAKMVGFSENVQKNTTAPPLPRWHKSEEYCGRLF